jgi:glycosyltransferase involved in cell wall biosynthesis
MRVLHIHSGNLYGGLETLLATFARLRNLCASMTPEFALCFEGRISEELAASGAAVHQLGAVRVRYPMSVYRSRRRLRELLKERRFDFAMFYSSWAQAIFAPVVREAGVTAVRCLHDPFNRRLWVNRWASRIPPDLIVAASRFMAKEWSGVYPNVPARVMYCPVERPELASGFERRVLRQQLGTAEDAVVIIQLSRMEEWKGQSVLLRALGLLRDDRNWVCWLVGGAQRPAEHRYLSSLEDLAGRLRIADRVRFLGQRRDAPELLAAADIHCQPNLGPEPFGIAFVEALFSGLPVVTSGFGGAVDIVDDDCGVLIPPNDPERLAIVLHSLIGDRHRREAMGAAGRLRAASLCDPLTRLQELSQFLAGATLAPTGKEDSASGRVIRQSPI